MENSPDNRNAEQYDTKLDHLVDTLGISYGEARQRLGEPPYELHDTPETEEDEPSPRAAASLGRQALDRRRRSGHGPQYGEEEGVGYPDGVPLYHQPYEHPSQEQQEINRRGLAKVRNVLRQNRQD